MVSRKGLAVTCGMLLLSGVLMAQTADQSSAAAANPNTTAQTANGPHRGAPDPEREAKHLGKKLGLSQDQVAQIQPILADRQQQVQSVRSDTTLAPKDRMAKIRGIREDSKNKIEAVLNDQQKQQFEQMQQSRGNHHKSAPQAQ